MKISKERMALYVILILVLTVLNVVTFDIPFERTTSFWVAYGFTTFAVVLSFIISDYAFRGDERRSQFYGLSLSTVVWVYMLIQTTVCLIMMCLPRSPVWVAAVINVLSLAICLIGLVAMDAADAAVSQTGQAMNQKVAFIKTMQGEVDRAGRLTDDAALRQLLVKLSDSVRYSDPMSSDLLVPLEEKIQYNVVALVRFVESGDSEGAKKLCTELQRQIADRAEKCRELK